MKNTHLQNQNQFNTFFENRFTFRETPGGSSDAPKKPRKVAMAPSLNAINQIGQSPRLNNLNRNNDITKSQKKSEKKETQEKGPYSISELNKKELSQLWSIARQATESIPPSTEMVINGASKKPKEVFKQISKGIKTKADLIKWINKYFDGNLKLRDQHKMTEIQVVNVGSNNVTDRPNRIKVKPKLPEKAKQKERKELNSLKKGVEKIRLPQYTKAIKEALDKIKDPQAIADFINKRNEKGGYNGDHKKWGNEFLTSIGIKNVKLGELRSYIRALQIFLRKELSGKNKPKLFDNGTLFSRVDGLMGPYTTRALAAYIGQKYGKEIKAAKIKINLPGLGKRFSKNKKINAQFSKCAAALANYIPQDAGFVDGTTAKGGRVEKKGVSNKKASTKVKAERIHIDTKRFDKISDNEKKEAQGFLEEGKIDLIDNGKRMVVESNGHKTNIIKYKKKWRIQSNERPMPKYENMTDAVLVAANRNKMIEHLSKNLNKFSVSNVEDGYARNPFYKNGEKIVFAYNGIDRDFYSIPSKLSPKAKQDLTDMINAIWRKREEKRKGSENNITRVIDITTLSSTDSGKIKRLAQNLNINATIKGNAVIVKNGLGTIQLFKENNEWAIKAGDCYHYFNSLETSLKTGDLICKAINKIKNSNYKKADIEKGKERNPFYITDVNIRFADNHWGPDTTAIFVANKNIRSSTVNALNDWWRKEHWSI